MNKIPQKETYPSPESNPLDQTPGLETSSTKDPSAQDQLSEMHELLKRTQANFENYRKQSEKRIEEIKQQAAREVILEILSLIDNLELALRSVPAPPTQFTQGIELIYAQFQVLLEKQGVAVISTDLKMYDPYIHEPLLRVESQEPENTVLEILQKGYTLNGKVLRHAKVKVSSGPEKKNKISTEHT